GLVMMEQTAVSEVGRSTQADLGLWRDDHIEPLREIAAFVSSQGAVPGIQLGHSGRKGSIRAPWEDRTPMTRDTGGWEPVAPSAISCGDGRPIPRALAENEIDAIIDDFAAAASRAARAGFRMLEVHGAHGYLVHQFLSPLSNHREDLYGGDFGGRSRFVVRLMSAVRKAWPEDLPVAIRLSALDDLPGGWEVNETLQLMHLLAEVGVDLFDISIGGLGSTHAYPTEPAALAPLSGMLRRETGLRVAVGWGIAEPDIAEQIIAHEQADLVFLARAMLRDPYWATHASEALGGASLLPIQIRR
ncbi:MAG: hypothetical protein ACM3YM_02365, partial [Sphingomonadales bacterium]